MNLENRKSLIELENELTVAVGQGWGKGQLESLGWTCTHCYIKVDNQQGPTVLHIELYSTLYGSLNQRGVWGRMGTCICMTEPLCRPPETITTLLIGFTLIQNKKLKKKKKERKIYSVRAVDMCCNHNHCENPKTSKVNTKKEIEVTIIQFQTSSPQYTSPVSQSNGFQANTGQACLRKGYRTGRLDVRLLILTHPSPIWAINNLSGLLRLNPSTHETGGQPDSSERSFLFLHRK